jgi:hypothetical protein
MLIRWSVVRQKVDDKLFISIRKYNWKYVDFSNLRMLTSMFRFGKLEVKTALKEY